MAGLNYQEEYIFPGLNSSNGRPLRFDFAVFDDDGNIDFLIEYQGIQHYEARSKFGGYGELRKQQFNDMRKREYCEKHGYFKYKARIRSTDSGKIYVVKTARIISEEELEQLKSKKNHQNKA